jgi:hypothetical protein
VGKLVRIRQTDVGLTRGVRPHDVPSARRAVLDGAAQRNGSSHRNGAGQHARPAAGNDTASSHTAIAASGATPANGTAPAPDEERPRARHAARHARTSSPKPARRTSLSIRSAERRRWSAELSRPDLTALVIHGLGGIGKSTLAAQIAARVSQPPEGAISAVSGAISAASLVTESVQLAGAGLLVLDSFDDNLSDESGLWRVKDAALADLLAGWTGKLLITCGRPFTLPGLRRERIAFRHLGPLTRSGAAEFALSLPVLRLLTEAERDLAWRLVAGHPRAMEYLDALLATGARFDDAAVRITAAVEARTGKPPSKAEPTELSAATAEVVAAAAGSQMFGELYGRLSVGAQALLVRASVFRTPVGLDVLAARPTQLAECEAAGLLTAGPGRERSVHRWTAAELHLRLAEAGLSTQLAAAHSQAAGYWRSRIAASPLGQQAQLEASYHLHRASELADEPHAYAADEVVAQAAGSPGRAGRTRLIPRAPRLRRTAARAGDERHRLRRLGLVSVAGVVTAALAIEAANTISSPHLASADRATNQAGQTPLAQAVQIRNQAAAWVVSQVGAGTVLSCDPAMCAVLVQHGIPAGNLLVLGPGSTDPLGSAVVLATAAVRNMFGSRLASVYAPDTLASFGAGQAQIDVRIVAPGGTAAYRTALAADVRARQAAGLQLVDDRRVTATPAARAALVAGLADARLLITLAAMAANEPVRIVSFGDAGPGASPGLPLPSVQVQADGATGRNMLAFARAQRPPYLPARSALSRGPGGQTILTIQFAAPSPLGLLQPQP